MTASQVMRVGVPPKMLSLPVSLLFAVVESTVIAPAMSGTNVITTDKARAVMSTCLKNGFKALAMMNDSPVLIRKNEKARTHYTPLLSNDHLPAE